MPRYIAFLRAINVGGHVVTMDRLRDLFEKLNLANVETFIASGNVIFETRATNLAALEQRIERSLHAALGYDVETFLRTPAEVAAAAAHVAFPHAEPGNALAVGFLREEPSPGARAAVAAFDSDVEEIVVHGRELYWLRRVGMNESKLTGQRLEKLLGMPSTARNVTTVRKLAAKYPAG